MLRDQVQTLFPVLCNTKKEPSVGYAVGQEKAPNMEPSMSAH